MKSKVYFKFNPDFVIRRPEPDPTIWWIFHKRSGQFYEIRGRAGLLLLHLRRNPSLDDLIEKLRPYAFTTKKEIKRANEFFESLVEEGILKKLETKASKGSHEV